MARHSATTPWPAKAASPWISSGRTGYDPGGSIWSWRARTMPSTIGSTVSRWLGLAASSTVTSLPRRADVLAGRAEVVLHVAGALDGVGVDVALELPEDLVVALAHDVGEHVEPAAVGHAEHHAVECRRRRPPTGSCRGWGWPTRRPRARTAWCRRTWWRGTSRTPRRRSAGRGGGAARGWRAGPTRPRPSTGSSAARRCPGCACTRCRCVRQYASRRTWRIVAELHRVSVPATPPVRNSRSRSQIVRP